MFVRASLCVYVRTTTSYVIMMPLFFVWLVKNGVHEVYVGGYRHRVQVHKRKLKLLKSELKAAEDARKARSVTPAHGERPRDVELATADAKETPGNPQPKKLARDSKALRALIRKERKRIDRVYTYEVQQNPKAQTYLYQPYNYRCEVPSVAAAVAAVSTVPG